jgi:hypothetical protein
MSNPLARLKAATPQQQALLDAVIAADWTMVTVPFPGSVILGHPDNGTPIPTPDWAREEYAPGRASYPFPTHTALRTLTILYTVTGPVTAGPLAGAPEVIPVKIYSVLTREAHAPWVTAATQKVSLKKALAFIAEPHPASPVPAEPVPAESGQS